MLRMRLSKDELCEWRLRAWCAAAYKPRLGQWLVASGEEAVMAALEDDLARAWKEADTAWGDAEEAQSQEGATE